MSKSHSEPNVWKGALAGLVAGLAALWAMDRFQDVWVSFSSGNDSRKDDKSGDNNREPSNSRNEQSDDDATVKAASTLSEGVFGHELTPDQKKIAGPAVHYAVGAAGGIVYGVAAELAPEITKGAGLPYGAAFWLVVDEGLVPLLGFAKGRASIRFQLMRTHWHRISFSAPRSKGLDDYCVASMRSEDS